jgi:MOSC domain-containing protein YiiM
VSKIVAVCTSEEKGTRKKAVNEGLFREDYGLVGDAHADCCTHRQVSLLARESIDKMLALGVKVGPGDFAENITTEGMIYRQAGVCVMPTEGIFTRVICGGVAKVGDQLTVYLG